MSAARPQLRPPTATSDDPVDERRRARTAKRRSAAAGQELGQTRAPSGRSEASNPEEKRLERELVLAGLRDRETDEKGKHPSADELASLSSLRSSPEAVRGRLREGFLAATAKRPGAQPQPAGEGGASRRAGSPTRGGQEEHVSAASQPPEGDAAQRRPAEHAHGATKRSRRSRKAEEAAERRGTRLPTIPTAVNRGHATPASRPLSSLGEDATPRVNPYLQDVRPPTPQGADVNAADPKESISRAFVGSFRPPSPLQRDSATGNVLLKRYSRPQSAASDETDFSQSVLADVRQDIMNPMAVHLTPLGAVFDEASQGSDDSMMLHSDDEDGVTEVYLDQVLDDPVPHEQAEFEPCTPSSSEEVSESSRSVTPEPEEEEEEELSEDEHVAHEASAARSVLVPGLSIEIKRDVLRVSKDLAGSVDEWQRAITKVLDIEHTAAEVERVSARIPGVVVIQVVFRNTEAASEHEAQKSFSRMSSGASAKSGSKGWKLLRRASSVASAVKKGKDGGAGEGGDAALKHVESAGSFARIGSHTSTATGFVLKGSAAKRVRNDCMSRDPHVWQEAIHNYVEMRAVQVEVLLPQQGSTPSPGIPGAEADGAPAADLGKNFLKSLKKGTLVKIAEWSPRLGLLAAGSRTGAGTIIRATHGQRNSAARGADAGASLVSVWWHDTGLLTQHSSGVSSAEDPGLLAPGVNASTRNLNGAEASTRSLVSLREHGSTSLLGVDCLQVFSRALGVHAKAEPGLMVRSRPHYWQAHHHHRSSHGEHHHHSHHGAAWALEDAPDAGYVVSEEVLAADEQSSWKQTTSKRSLDRKRRMCYVIWKQDASHTARPSSPNRDADKALERRGLAATPAQPVLIKLKELSAIKVPDARLAALLRSEGDAVALGSASCRLCIGLRVQVSSAAYDKYPDYLADSADGPGVVVAVKTSVSAEYERPADSAFPEDFHSLQVAWLRTERLSSYDLKLIRDGFLEVAGGERVVGSTAYPAMLGMRVRFVDRLRFLDPITHSDSGGGPGTISWVSPWDPEDSSKSGGVCQVIWDWTGVRDCYRTGYKGDFYLRLLDENAMRNHHELVLGSALHAEVGQRVRLAVAARVLLPSLSRGCEAPWGCGTVTRVLDLESSALGRHLMLRSSEAERQRKQAASMVPAAAGPPEQLVGIDLKPVVGMRVMLSREARKNCLHALEGRLHSGSDDKSAASAGDARLETAAAQQVRTPHHYFCTGTVVQVGRATLPGQEASPCPIGTVDVLWDNGYEGGLEQAPAQLDNPLDSNQKITHLCNVGRDGVFELIVVHDQILLGCPACPLALGLRVALCRRMVEKDSLALIETGDGPGEVHQIIGWQPPPADSPVVADADQREIVTADTEMASEGDSEDEGENDQHDVQSSRSGGTGVRSAAKSEGSGVKGKLDAAMAVDQAQEEPKLPPESGEVVVKWDKTGKEQVYRCGVQGEFCLALWAVGGNWQGRMCEVRWDGAGAMSTLAYERGYEYKYSINGLKTRQIGEAANKILPLVLAEEKPDVAGIVLHLIDHACELVEHEIQTQQKAATLMQKLARGVWGRRRIRRLRVVASSREVVRTHAAGARFDLSQMLKRRQAFPPFSQQWRLLVLLHRMQETLSALPKFEKASVPPDTLRAADEPIAPDVARKMRECARLLADDDLHAKEKSEAVVKLTALMTHSELSEQRHLQDAAVSQGVVAYLLEAMMGVVASEPPEDAEAKHKGAWAAEILGHGDSNPVNISKEMEQAVEQLQHAASLALAQIALSNRRTCHALVGAGCMQVVGLLLEKGRSLHDFLAEALVGIVNNVAASCPLAPALALDTCPGFLHDLVALLHPPRDDAAVPDDASGGESANGEPSVEERMTPMGVATLSQEDIVNLMRVADAPFRLPRTGKPAEELAGGDRQPLTSLQTVTLMALSAMASRDAACRIILSRCGLVKVLECILPHLTKLEEYGPPQVYAGTPWGKDGRLPHDFLAVCLYLCVKPSPPQRHTLSPPPLLGSVGDRDLARVVLDAATDWLSYLSGQGGASAVEKAPMDRSPAKLSRIPSITRAGSIGSGQGWDAIRRLGSVERVASANGKTLGWTIGCITKLAQRGALPDSRAHAPLSSLTRHAIILDREKAKEGFGRASSGGSNSGFSRAGSGGSGLARLPSFARVPSNASRGSKFGRVPSFGRVGSGASNEIDEAEAAMRGLQALKTQPVDRAAKGLVGLASLPVAMHLAMALSRLCATAEGRQAVKETQGCHVISKLVSSQHVGPYARRLLIQALVLLTYKVSAAAPAAPRVAARELGAGPKQRSQLTDEEMADEVVRAQVVEAVLDLEFMETLKQDPALLKQLASIADDPALLDHVAILDKAAAPQEDLTDEAEGAAEGLSEATMRTGSGEALEIAEPGPEVWGKGGAAAAAVLEEIHGGGDDMLARLEGGWRSDLLASTLAWQISNFAESSYATITCLEYLVRDSGHVIIVCPEERAQDEALLAQELARQHLVVWGQGDEKMTGLDKQDRPVDDKNSLIPLPTWLSLGVGACSAVLVLWTPRFEEDVRCVAQVVYARCLGKTILLLERCSNGLWERPLATDGDGGGTSCVMALDSVPRSPSDASSDTSSTDEVSTLPGLEVPPASLEAVSDALADIDDHHGRYAVVGRLQLRPLSESECAPESLLAVSTLGSSVLWASADLGSYIKKPVKALKRVIPAHTVYWMHPTLRDLALKELALRELAKQKASAKREEEEEEGRRDGEELNDEDEDKDKDKGPIKRMAVDYNEVAAAQEAAEAADLMAQHEASQMQRELVGVAQRVVRRLGGCGICPGPLAMRVSAPDARAMQLATRALAITRAESAANKAAALKTSSSNASLKASASAASPASRARAEVETFDDEPGPRGASNEGDVGGVSARDEHALIRDLAAATGLHHEQIVVLGSIGSSDSASVCLALLHMSVGNFGRSLMRLQAALSRTPSLESGDQLAGPRRRRSRFQFVDPYLPSPSGADVRDSIPTRAEDHALQQRLQQHWGLLPPVIVMREGQGAEADTLGDMMASLERRLNEAERAERVRQGQIISARIVAETQMKALRAVSEKLGLRYREPGKPRLILELYDRQEQLGQVSMDLNHAEWQRVQAAIQRSFGRAADLGYFATGGIDDETLKEMLRATKRRSRTAAITYEAPLQLSPARSQPRQLQRVHNKKSFQIFLALAKSASIFAMDETGGIQALDENKPTGGIWEDGSIDVIAHVHVLWLDKAPEPHYLGQLDEDGGASQPSSPSHSRPSSMSMSRPTTGTSRPVTAEWHEADAARPYTGQSGKALLVKKMDGPLPPLRPGSRRQEAPEVGSRGSVDAMTGVPPTPAAAMAGTVQDGPPEASDQGRPTTRSRMHSRRSSRNVATGRLGTAASGLYREISSSQALNSHAGAAGLLHALDTFPSFKEPRAARLPPSKRKALLQGAKQGATAAFDESVTRVGSAASFGSRAIRRVASGVAIKPGEFGSFRNLLLDWGEYEPSMVSRLEASSVLEPECGPEKAIDGLPNTRWASNDAAGSSITIHLKNTCLFSEFRFRQATPESGGRPGEWASVVSLFFSDDSEQEFVVNATEEAGLELQSFTFKPTAAEWVRVMVKASHGNRGAAFTDVQLLGYDACNENLLVRHGEKVQAALTAVQAGGVIATVWVAAGTYFESLEIMCPVTVVALTTQPSIICSLDPTRPAITCSVPGVYLHGLAVLQAGDALSSAADSFRYDRHAPGVQGAHWTNVETIRDDFGSYEGFSSHPRDPGRQMGVWDRVKTTKAQGQGMDERQRRLAADFPAVLADVVRYEEILARFEESGADHIAELRQQSSELKLHKAELKNAAQEARKRVADDRRSYHDELRTDGAKAHLTQSGLQNSMIREELRGAEGKRTALHKATMEHEAQVEFLEAQMAESAERGEALVVAVKRELHTPAHADVEEDLRAWTQAQADTMANYEKAKAKLSAERLALEAATEELQEAQARYAGSAAEEAAAVVTSILRDILQTVHEEMEVAPELAEIDAEIEATRHERKLIKKEIASMVEEAAEANARVKARVDAVEAMRKELEPAALYASYGAELVVTRCRVRSALGSGIVAGPRALVVARDVSITDCGRHGVFCHNGGRIVLDAVSILRCRQYGALALHANVKTAEPEHQGEGEEDGDGSGSTIQAEAAKPATPKTPNFSRAGTPLLVATPARPQSRGSTAGSCMEAEDAEELGFTKNAASSDYFGPPAIVARNTTLAYNGNAGVCVDLGGEMELNHCGVLSNRREGLVVSGEGTCAVLRDFVAASNGAQGLHVNMHALVVAKNAKIIGNGEQGCLVVGHLSTLKLQGGVVRLNALEGLEMRGGGFVALRDRALVHRNYPALTTAVQAKVDGVGSWLDSEASSIGDQDSARNAYPADVVCENGGKAHLHWPPELEIAEDLGAFRDPEARGTYKHYRKDGRTLDIDQTQVFVAGERRIRIKCHSGVELSSPAVREYEWITSAAACNHFELAQYVRKCVAAEDQREASLPPKHRKPPLRIPDGLARAWKVFYTERATADESIQHEGDLLGPIVDQPIWDKLSEVVCLHLYPNDQAGPEARRQKAAADRLIQQQLAEVNRARALERENKLARMYPEQRQRAVLEYQQQQEQHHMHVLHMQQVRAAKDAGLGPSDRIPTPIDPEKDNYVKGKGRAMYEAFQGLGSADSDWVPMKEDRSGDQYWWNPITGAISWVNPADMRESAEGQVVSAAQPVQREQEDDLREMLKVLEDTEASETDVRVALERLNSRGKSRSRLKNYEHRII